VLKKKKSDTLAEVVNFIFLQIIPAITRIFLLHTETCTVKLNTQLQAYLFIILASHYPTPLPYFGVSWTRTLPWVTWEAVTVVEGIP